jgi:hypothetical protein
MFQKHIRLRWIGAFIEFIIGNLGTVFFNPKFFIVLNFLNATITCPNKVQYLKVIKLVQLTFFRQMNMKFMNVSCISMSTFINHQKFYLYPAIGSVWHNFQRTYVQEITEQQIYVTLGGDGGADTPGHCAKYCSYSMLD